MYNSRVFSIFRVVQLSLHQFWIFISPKKEALYLSTVTTCFFPILHPTAPSTNNCLFSLSVDLPVLDISYKWDHTICSLLQLASFTQHHVSKVQPYYSLYLYFIPSLLPNNIPLCNVMDWIVSPTRTVNSHVEALTPNVIWK